MRFAFLVGLLCLPAVAGAVLSDAEWCANRAPQVQKASRRYTASCLRHSGCSATSKRFLTKRASQYAERCVAMNQIQVLASHNAYHVEPKPDLMQALLNFSSLFEGDQYTHVPLDQQLGDENIRQMEIDIWADPNGGLFSVRHGLLVLNQDPNANIPELLQPGFKVLHLPDIDFETRCYTLVECLQQVKTWHDGHPNHLPIGIQIESENDGLPDVLNLGFIVPIPIDGPLYDEFDAEVRSVFSADELLTPDDVRGDFPTLEQAILTRGWPKLKDARGKIIFVHDNGGNDRLLYQRGHTSLEGLVMFTNSNPGQPDAAFVKRNDPTGDANQADIKSLVAAGYLVRTRADADTVEARANDTSTRDAALASGAQYVSTDYPEPDLRFSDYHVTIPDGPFRCDPINAPPGCVSVGIAP